MHQIILCKLLGRYTRPNKTILKEILKKVENCGWLGEGYDVEVFGLFGTEYSSYIFSFENGSLRKNSLAIAKKNKFLSPKVRKGWGGGRNGPFLAVYRP